MRSCITEFLDHRMEEIAQSLRGSNAAYSLAVEKSQFLFESIEPIISNKKGYHRLTRGNRPDGVKNSGGLRSPPRLASASRRTAALPAAVFQLPSGPFGVYRKPRAFPARQTTKPYFP